MEHILHFPGETIHSDDELHCKSFKDGSIDVAALAQLQVGDVMEFRFPGTNADKVKAPKVFRLTNRSEAVQDILQLHFER